MILQVNRKGAILNFLLSQIVSPVVGKITTFLQIGETFITWYIYCSLQFNHTTVCMGIEIFVDKIKVANSQMLGKNKVTDKI